MNNPINIMLVENNDKARRALAVYLSLQGGIRITAEAANGLEAINEIKNQPPDIVLMDMRMPVMDGLEATRIIKKRWPKIKVVVLTMYQIYQSEALSAGADAFLVKDCSTAELVYTVRNMSQPNTIDKHCIEFPGEILDK